jgi:hypothetical protein
MNHVTELQPLADAGLLVYVAEPVRFFVWKPKWDGIDLGGDIVAGWLMLCLDPWPSQLSDCNERGARYKQHYRELYGPDHPVFATTGPNGQLGAADGNWRFVPGAQRLGGVDRRPKRIFDSLVTAMSVIIHFYAHVFPSNCSSEEELAHLLASV